MVFLMIRATFTLKQFSLQWQASFSCGPKIHRASMTSVSGTDPRAIIMFTFPSVTSRDNKSGSWSSMKRRGSRRRPNTSSSPSWQRRRNTFCWNSLLLSLWFSAERTRSIKTYRSGTMYGSNRNRFYTTYAICDHVRH